MLPTSKSRIQASPQTFKYIGITFVVVFTLVFIFGCSKNVSEYQENSLFKNSNKHNQVEDKTSAAAECAVYRRVNSKAVEHDDFIKRRCTKHVLAHSFEDIARKFESRKWYGDSSTQWEYPHDEAIYENYLPPYRFKEIKFLEIGLGCEGGGSGYKLAGFSAKTWLNTFPTLR